MEGGQAMKKFILTITALLTLTQANYGQVYELAERSNPWNQGRNITGLRNDSTTVSYAELYGGFQAGGFHQHHEPASSWKAGLIAESMLHLEKMSMKGLFSFENRQEYQSCGSMLIRQDHYPVNVIEFTPGTKNRQKYAFNGGLAYELAPEWRIGGNLGFTSMNWAKRKDLRHTTYLLDLWLTPSIQWHRNDFQFGLSYILSKNSESVKASQIGDTAEEYKVFLDKGLHYGTYENWEGNGVHLKEPGIDGFPIREIYNGAAFQFSWKDLYMDAEYLYGSGKAGEKDFVWFEFPSHQLKVFLNYRLCRPQARHHFRLNVRFRHLENNENLLEKTTEGGISTAKKYASNLIYVQERLSFAPEYEIIAKKWRIRWNLEYNHTKEITSQIFPYICTGLQHGFQTSLEGKVHLWKFELGADLKFALKKITETERTLADAAGIGAPVRIPEYSDLWLCYERASKLDCGLSLRYNFWKGLYLDLSGSYLRAFDMADNTDLQKWFADPDRWGVALKLGWNF